MNLHRAMLIIAASVLPSLVAGGCSTQARRVNCEGRLEPINQLAGEGKEVLPQGLAASSGSKEESYE